MLLHNLYFEQEHIPTTNLAQAIQLGFMWSDDRIQPKVNNKDDETAEYWSDVYDQALAGAIETFPHTLNTM
jgi:hypothetical protein